MNPAEQLTFDGTLDCVRMYADTKGFTPHEIHLSNGLVFDNISEKRPFDRQVIKRNEERIVGFGNIIDTEGFERARDRITQEGIYQK